MLILSKHRDYYDSAHNGYIDKTIIYRRTTEDITDKKDNKIKAPEFNIPRFAFGAKYDRESYKIMTEQLFFVVGFCGKFYPLLKYIKYNFRTREVLLEEYIYDIDEIINTIVPSAKVKSEESNVKSKRIELREFLEGIEKTNIDKLHLELNSPVFLIDRHVNMKQPWYSREKFRITVDPILKDIQFYKVKDPAEAFQLIQIFISNILTNNSTPPANVTDKTKILSHGFDYKWSFRKEKK